MTTSIGLTVVVGVVAGLLGCSTSSQTSLSPRPYTPTSTVESHIESGTKRLHPRWGETDAEVEVVVVIRGNGPAFTGYPDSRLTVTADQLFPTEDEWRNYPPLRGLPSSYSVTAQHFGPWGSPERIEVEVAVSDPDHSSYGRTVYHEIHYLEWDESGGLD